MRLLLSALFFLTTATAAYAAPTQGEWASTEHTRARLVAPEAIAGGEPFFLAVEVELQPQWHTYWINPGDSGIPTRLKPALPEGFTAGPLHFPLPHRFETEGLLNYGYSEYVSFLLPVTPPANLAEGESFKVDAKLDMLVCKDVCVPEKAALHVTLQSGDAAAAEQASADSFFTNAQKAIPNIYRATDGRFSEKDGQIHFTLPPSLKSQLLTDRDLFVLTQGVTALTKPAAFENGTSSETAVTLPIGTVAVGDDIEAVLTTDGDGDDDTNSWQLRFFRTDAAASAAAPSTNAAEAVPSTHAAATPQADESYLVILLSAILGGLILNAMPCVFPVLSLKALAIARKAESDASVVRAHGIAYTAGVLLCFVALGALMLALQSAGRQIGWGFQLQSPGFVAAMASLFFLLGLNLLGLFEFPLLGANLQTGGKESSKSSFFTGLLAALVATPCTAPFMGSALGAAIGKPAIEAIGVFVALGLGMALPFLLLSVFPHLARCLPKPGLWMQRLKEILAFPMLAAALWLLWVLAQQVGPIGFAWSLVALLLVGIAIYGWRLVQFAPATRRWIWLLLMLVLWGFTVRAIAQDHTVAVATDELSYVLPNAESYSAERLSALRSEGRAVFVDATADWCLTCKVNERGALGSEQVKALFAKHNIAVLVADWTNEDPAITALLKEFGRNGVPLYAFYPADGSAPRLMPQLLTPGTVASIIEP